MKLYSLDIAMFVSGLPFDGSTIPSGKSLGGSETSAVQMAEALTKQGHRVSIFCNCEEPKETNGVLYSPIGWVNNNRGGFPKGFYDYIRSVPTDVCIVQRIPSMFQFETRAKVNLLWQHDLATRTGPSQFQAYAWNIDRILVLSQFMKKQYQEVHGGPDAIYHLTRNGIDLDAINAVPAQQRDRFRMTYTARPERGLDILLRAVFPKILQREPRAKLYISRYQDPNVMEFYAQLENEMKRFGDRIEFFGNLGKKALYENYKKSRLYIYPSMFEEISCLTAMETSACGLVFLGPWRAALPETIGGCAPLVKDDGFLAQLEDAPETGLRMPSLSFIDGIVDQAVRLMRDDEYHSYWQSKALARSASLSWDKVAQDWIELSHNIIAEKSGNDRRLVRHFLFNSDVVAARKFAVKKNDKALVQSVENYVNRYVPFMSNSLPENQKPTINQFYEQRSGGVNANYSTGFFADKEVRLIQLKEFLRPKIQSGEIKSLLDFGCAHGGYARSLTDEFPTLYVVGIDNSASLIRCCNEMKAAIGQDDKPVCKNPQNMAFAVGDENGGWDDLSVNPGWKGYDCVVSMEVLEHLPNAEEAATKLEALCKPDGWVVFTVPSGHRERDELVTKNIPPVHVRSFDLHDIRDLFGQKPNYWVTSFSDLQEAAMDRSFSCWFMVTFQADHKKIGSIDYERKFFLQAPRQTLAVCVIAHNSEDVMHRCLRSVVKYADQIVIVDNGPSNDRTAEIAGEYTDDVREGTSPFWCYTHAVVHPPEVIDPNVCEMAGFETPRNESVEGVWTDFICWVDCDEQLLEATNLSKYLRQNIYLGYAIQQHHISIDALAAMKRDVPVRLYRNIPGMRFYGCLISGTEVVTNPDLKPIEDIGVGTLVRTHDGSYRPVTKLWRYDVDDIIVSVLARGMPEPMKLTQDHKVYAIRHSQCFYNYGRNYICKPTCEKSCPHRFYEHYSPDWIMSKDLRVGDILLYPIDDAVRDIDTITLSNHAKSGRIEGKGAGTSWKLSDNKWERTIRGKYKTINDIQPLTDKLLRLCGYYVSDGHISEEGKLHISFGANELAYAEDAQNAATEIGLEAVIHAERNMQVVTIYGRPLCEWLAGEFNSGSRNKIAPLSLMRLPPERQKAFLTGLWRGDGNITGTLLRYSTVNKVLAQQVQDLLLRQKVLANIRFNKRSKVYEVFARKQNRFLDWDMPASGQMRARQCWMDSKFVYMPIREIKRERYVGTVHDLTVEGNHSFVANRAVVSNCVHEHAELGINKGIGANVMVISDVHIHHDGYLVESIRRERFKRNLRLLQCDRKKYPDRLLGWFLYEIRDCQHMARYAMEQNGGAVTDEVRQMCETTINAYRTKFMKEQMMMSDDAMQYYSNALAILGLGIDVSADIEIAKQGTAIPPQKTVAKFRAMDPAEAIEMIRARVNMAAAPHMGRYVQ